jgi:hypothetical protein
MNGNTGEPLVNKPGKDKNEITGIIKTVFSVPMEEITCGDCYEVIDQYVDMLLSGQDPEVVLPKVKEHLGQCRCCHTEFRALISILEAAAKSEEDVGPQTDSP